MVKNSSARALSYRTLDSETDMREGLDALARRCRTMRRLAGIVGVPGLRRHPAGFPGLARIVVGQQLSIASAGAIWSRLEARIRPMQPHRFLAAEDEALRAAGLSAGKIRTLRALAGAVMEDGLDLTGLSGADEEDVRARLTTVSGIGPWTADIYMLFCLGRADAWASGDLALQTAAGMALALRERPSAQALSEMGERWRPWRGVAAHVLWAYYAHERQSAMSAPGGRRRPGEAPPRRRPR